MSPVSTWLSDVFADVQLDAKCVLVTSVVVGIGLAAACWRRCRPRVKLPHPWPPPFEVIDTVDRGKCVRSLQSYQPGEVIFTEAPLLQWPLDGEVHNIMPIRPFLNLSPDAKKHLLSLYCEDTLGTDGWAKIVGSRGENLDSILEHARIRLPISTAIRTNLWRLMRIAEVNTTTGPGYSALYRWFSRINHSCLPNVCCVSRENGEIVWVAARAVAPGDELCDTYIVGDPSMPFMDTLLLPTTLRQDSLQRWGFVCTCSRCSAPNEPETIFQCTSCRQGYCAADRSRGVARIAECNHCGVAPPEKDGMNLLAQEARVVAAAKRLGPLVQRSSKKAFAMMENLRGQCRSLGLAETHWLVSWLDILTCERQDTTGVREAQNISAQLRQFFEERCHAQAKYT